MSKRSEIDGLLVGVPAMSDDQIVHVSDPRTFPDRAAPGADGTVRKAHYGDGKQPWDYIVEAGWAPEFAAGCVLRYLRRDKDPEHSLESARWYWARLREMATREGGIDRFVLGQLEQMLTADELATLS